MASDLRYEFVRCTNCGRDWQFIDWGCARHRITCDPDYGPEREAMMDHWFALKTIAEKD